MGQKDIAHGSSGIEGRGITNSVTIRPAIDIFENSQGLTLVADLPGVGKEELKIEIEQGLLTLSAVANSYLKGEAIRREFTAGRFFRQFQLPEEIDAGKISAEMHLGVLTLNMPKSAAAQPRRIEISSS